MTDRDEFRKTYKSGKPQLRLIHWRGVREVARVREFGNVKHGGDNLHLAEDVELIEAAMRHCAELLEGKVLDHESGLHAAAHAATSLLYVVERYRLQEEQQTEGKNDDYFPF